jgi:hypothetical protein
MGIDQDGMKTGFGTLVTLAVCATLAGPCRANPVPDAVANQFRALVRQTAQTGVCPDTTQLAEYFGRFGLDLLSTSERAAVESQFEVFAPLLVEAQRPGQTLSFEVQALFRRRAGTTEREAMQKVLREWLTAPSSTLASGVDVSYPPSAVAAAVQRTRVTAAEMLAEWGDQSAGPLMARLAAPDTMSAEMAWHLARARECLRDPDARTFLVIDPDSSVRVNQTVEEVKEAGLRQGNLTSGQNQYRLNPAECRDLWAVIRESRVVDRGQRMGGGYSVVLEFADGVRASLSPTQPGYVVYTDNTSLDWRRWGRLKNEQLYKQISALVRREFGERAH